MGLLREIIEEWAWYSNTGNVHIFWKPLREAGFYIMCVYRLGHRAAKCRIPVLNKLYRLFYMACKLLVVTVTGVYIRPGAIIGKHFTIHTFPSIWIAHGVRIGDGCTINMGVSIAHRANNRGEGVPTIGNHVYIGIGAKIIGKVTIGDHAVIGASAVVLTDVPAYAMAVGIPAKIRQSSPRNAKILK